MADPAIPGASSRDAIHRDLIAVARRQHEGAAQADGGASDSVTVTPPGSSFSGPPPDSFAGYQILREVHRGGQGVVYQALQKSTNRKVAIKVMREGPFAGAADKARFEREVQVLGQLKHPNIVAIHDTGIAAGCHFFVMDYISGQPLDVYMAGAAEPEGTGNREKVAGKRDRGGRGSRRAGARRADSGRPGLSVDSTLRLFVKICEAVNAAHLRGVIHRDLKPGNIRIDNDGEPHVLDFGLAKVATPLSPPLEGGDARGVMTMTGQFVGSLPWASPEQAEGTPGKVDIRTDVYSLGVVLYQMLTGKFPYEVVGSMRDVLDRIMHAEPVRPRTIRREINDEVETIVLKCLSKERERRYQSAGELARDIERYLRHEPIEAKRDSGWYTLRKTVRRYRIPVVIATLAAFWIGDTSVMFWWRYTEARANTVAMQQERDRAASSVKFLQDMLSSADPEQVGGNREFTVREVLDSAARRLEQGELREQPLTAATVRLTLGKSYHGLGLYAVAEPHLRTALQIFRDVRGKEHEDVARTITALSELLYAKGEYEEAESHCRESLAMRRSLLGSAHADVGESLNNLAGILLANGDANAAEPLFREALAIYRAQGTMHPMLGTVAYNLAFSLQEQGDYGQAEALYREAIAIAVRVYGSEHALVAWYENSLAGLLHLRGDLTSCEKLYRKVLAMRYKLLGHEHPQLAWTLDGLAAVLRDRGECDASEPLFREAVAMRRKLLGDRHPDLALSLDGLGMLLTARRDCAAAAALHREALEIRHQALPPDHWLHLSTMSLLGEALSCQAQFREAEPLLLECYDRLLRNSGYDHALKPATAARLVQLYENWHAAEPGRGYDAKAAEWRATLAEWQASTQPASQPDQNAPEP